MAEALYKVMIGMMILPFWALMVPAVTLPEDKIYLFAVLFGFGVILFIHEKLLYFLTLEKVFITSLLASTILCSAYLFFMDLTIPGFQVEEISVGGLEFAEYQLPVVELGLYGTIALLAVASGITYYLLMRLKSEF